MADYVDLLITDNDITLDYGGEPLLVDDQASIVQDIKHLIRESGLLSAVIGERDNAKVAWLLQRLEILIEDDVRLIPGTINITRQETELFFVTADTVKYNPINIQVSA